MATLEQVNKSLTNPVPQSKDEIDAGKHQYYPLDQTGLYYTEIDTPQGRIDLRIHRTPLTELTSHEEEKLLQELQQETNANATIKLVPEVVFLQTTEGDELGRHIARVAANRILVHAGNVTLPGSEIEILLENILGDHHDNNQNKGAVVFTNDHTLRIAEIDGSTDNARLYTATNPLSPPNGPTRNRQVIVGSIDGNTAYVGGGKPFFASLTDSLNQIGVLNYVALIKTQNGDITTVGHSAISDPAHKTFDRLGKNVNETNDNSQAQEGIIQFAILPVNHIVELHQFPTTQVRHTNGNVPA